MIDFSQVTNITLGGTSVEQIADSQGNILWSAYVDPSTVYFYVEDTSGQSNTLTINKGNNSAPTITVYKSSDGTNWNSIGNTSTTGITATIPANGKLYLKATANSWSTSTYFNKITASGAHNVGGNIMSLLYGDEFKGKTVFPSGSTYNFRNLFNNNTKLVSAENLVLPATTLVSSCYSFMFQGCSSLTTAPALPATTLTDYCYQDMFRGCTSLTTAPALPATTLANSCYYNMFNNCTSLTTAPALPATTLTEHCYQNMFNGCTALTTAPELPYSTLANSCYSTMFNNCSNLKTVVYYGKSPNTALYTHSNWLNSVSATGDFYNLRGAVFSSGASGIPSGWTTHTSL